MPRGRILALRGLDPVAPGAGQGAPGRQVRRYPPRGGFRGKPEAETGEVGQAKRPLPQLKITVDSEGYLVADSPFREAVGPSFWERGTVE